MYESDEYPEYYDSDMWDDEDFSDELYDSDGRFVPEQFVQDSDVTDIEHDLDVWVNSDKTYRNAQVLLMFM